MCISILLRLFFIPLAGSASLGILYRPRPNHLPVATDLQTHLHTGEPLLRFRETTTTQPRIRDTGQKKKRRGALLSQPAQLLHHSLVRGAARESSRRGRKIIGGRLRDSRRCLSICESRATLSVLYRGTPPAQDAHIKPLDTCRRGTGVCTQRHHLSWMERRQPHHQ